MTPEQCTGSSAGPGGTSDIQMMLLGDPCQSVSGKVIPVVGHGYLTATGVVVNDLRGDGIVHVGEEHLGVAVRGHAAVHRHEGALDGLPPPGVVLLQGVRRGANTPEGSWGCSAGSSGGKQGLPQSLVAEPKEPRRQRKKADCVPSPRSAHSFMHAFIPSQLC